MSDENELTPGEHDKLWATVESGAEHVDRRRRQRRGIITGALAVVVIAGVLGGVGALAVSNRDQVMAPSPSPTQTVSPAPTRTATPTQTTSPTAAPSPTSTPPPADPPEVPIGDDPSQWIVTDAGMGPLTLGMHFSDAVGTLPDAQDACTFAFVAFDSELWVVGSPLTFDGPPGPLNIVSWGSGRIDSQTNGPRTPEGIGLGSTEAEVRATYPGAEEVRHNGFQLKTGNVWFRIADNGVVAEIGVTSADVPYEYCG